MLCCVLRASIENERLWRFRLEPSAITAGGFGTANNPPVSGLPSGSVGRASASAKLITHVAREQLVLHARLMGGFERVTGSQELSPVITGEQHAISVFVDSPLPRFKMRLSRKGPARCGQIGGVGVDPQRTDILTRGSRKPVMRGKVSL